MWIELFKIGKHPLAENQHDWTNADLDQIVANQTADKPITIDHPANGPIAKTAAFGWISKLENRNGTLFGKVENLVAEFALMLSKKMFKNVSIGLVKRDNGWTMGHLAFLGAKAPAVQGLSDIDFSLNESDSVVCSAIESEVNIIDTASNEDVDIDKLKPQNINHEENIMTMEQLQAELDKALAKIKELEAAKTSDNSAALIKENEELKVAITGIQAELRNNTFENFCKEEIEAGRLTPSEKDATIAIMKTLDGQEAIDFSVDGKNEKKSTLSIFQDTIRNRKPAVDFSETVKKDAARLDVISANTELKNKMAEYAVASGLDLGTNVSKIQAAVFAANPNLKIAVGA